MAGEKYDFCYENIEYRAKISMGNCFDYRYYSLIGDLDFNSKRWKQTTHF
jgi:hypothetical protein